MSSQRHRQLLPTNVKPLHYRVRLEPSLQTFDIDGTVTITLEVLEDSSDISLHQNEIAVGKVELHYPDDSSEQPSSTKYDESTQIYTASFPKPFVRGTTVQLSLWFTAKLNDKGVGFYRSTYQEDGQTKILAASQMQAIDARRAFPCFDEPGLKATFDITLVTEQHLTCLSNMNAIETTDLEGSRKSVHFATTPLMSTYLVALTIGEFDYIESTDFHVPVRVYTIPTSLKSAKWSLDAAVKLLKFYEEIYDSPFPLPKLDCLGIPEAGGAMENWGLVIFTESLLIWDEQHGSAQNQTYVFNVIAHELAHQWFGNIVTMKYWDGLWLNEGFATWMAWYASHKFYPEWNTWQNFVASTMQEALRLDCLPSTHPIEVPIMNDAEINQIFDSISYNKGSSVVQMIASYLSEDVFLKGVQIYLKRFAYGSTETEDLWIALSEASGMDVKELMSVWTESSGYPLIKVTEQGSHIHVEQHRYIQNLDDNIEDTLYPVMLGIRSKKETRNFIFNTREMDIPLDDLDFYKLNPDHNGLYRVLYEPRRVEMLGQAISDGLLTAQDRIGAFADVGALASSGHQKTTASLDLLKGLADETETLVWQQVLTNMNAMETAWYYQPKAVKDALQVFKRSIISPRLMQIGWQFAEKEDALLARQKGRLFQEAGMAGDERVVSAAKEMFSSFLSGNDAAINPNLRKAVFSIAVRYGGRAEFDAALNLYNNATRQNEREYLLEALGHTPDSESVRELLNFILTDKVGVHMCRYAFLGVSGEHREELWAWTQENFDAIQARFGEGLGAGAPVIFATYTLGTPELLEKGQSFFKSKDTSKFELVLASRLDVVKARVAWAERDKADVKAWLKQKGFME